MRNATTTKRIWIAALALMLTGAVGACSDQPMGIDEGYEVRMEAESADTDNCIWVEGQLYCNG